MYPLTDWALTKAIQKELWQEAEAIRRVRRARKERRS